MIDERLLGRATFVGIVLQVAMVVLGHFITWIQTNVFMLGGMFISGVAGLLYSRDLNRGWATGALGGAIAGATCAMAGVAISVILKDSPQSLIPFVVFASMLAGAVGGPFGQMAANMREEVRRATLAAARLRPPERDLRDHIYER
jgi:hypothetical protein